MLEMEKFNRTLVLTLFFSFSAYMLAFMSTIWSVSLNGLLLDTFLSNFISINELFIHLIMIIIKYTSLIFMVGSVLALIIIFMFDVVLKPTQNKI